MHFKIEAYARTAGSSPMNQYMELQEIKIFLDIKRNFHQIKLHRMEENHYQWCFKQEYPELTKNFKYQTLNKTANEQMG